LSQTNILMFTLVAMCAPGLGYLVGWLLDPTHAFWRALRVFGAVRAGVVGLTAATIELIAEYERLNAAASFEPGKAN